MRNLILHKGRHKYDVKLRRETFLCRLFWIDNIYYMYNKYISNLFLLIIPYMHILVYFCKKLAVVFFFHHLPCLHFLFLFLSFMTGQVTHLLECMIFNRGIFKILIREFFFPFGVFSVYVHTLKLYFLVKNSYIKPNKIWQSPFN